MAIYARLGNGTYAEVTGVFKTDGEEITEIFQGDRLVYSSSTELTGTLPLYYTGKGYDLTDYLISGEKQQDGTPSPDNIVDVVGCGVRTGNIFDKNATDTSKGYDDSGYLTSNGSVYRSSTYFVSEYIPVEPNNVYTLVYHVNALNAPSVCYYDENKAFISGGAYERQLPFSFTTPSNAAYIRFTGVNGAEGIIMLNLGSTALPYEPYGYKLPLTVNGTEYPIYLGQVPTTRRVKKFVLTGEETDWQKASSYEGCFYKYTSLSAVQMDAYCTHLPYIAVSDFKQGTITISVSKRINLWFPQFTSSSTVEDFKSYLAQQYAAGTPVTVWYVLAEPETGIVNEPLMKIGDYADTVDFSQAGVTIPTVSGANVLDMATVKPSAVTIKGKGIKTTGYGQLVDVNGTEILDVTGTPIYVHGQ